MNQSIFPPWYYKQFDAPDSLQAPNISTIQRGADDFVSFGKIQKFSAYKESPSKQLFNEMEMLGIDIQIPVKDILKKLNLQILHCCIKISESMGQANTDHGALTLELKQMTLKFNKVCQYVKLRESYAQLQIIYESEVLQLQQCCETLHQQQEDMIQNIHDFRNQLEQEQEDTQLDIDPLSRNHVELDK